ncbi:hypothetical protein [Exiguobacterium aurantiacum]|uniref:hypothetical protein n=1 Tax=Exiguobacterium aurantiacum TaxID=33987 RepID=UPI001E36A414|nr:hypothetical protein [Exiguobacterium aurantiacum]
MNQKKISLKEFTNKINNSSNKWTNIYNYLYSDNKNNKLSEYLINSYSYNLGTSNKNTEVGIVIDLSYSMTIDNQLIYLLYWYKKSHNSNSLDHFFTLAVQNTSNEQIEEVSFIEDQEEVALCLESMYNNILRNTDN